MTKSESVILAHLVGDYLIQSHWMATEKTSRWTPALAHAASYTAAYVPVTRSLKALAVIGATHAVIDHYRLARHVVWAKNQLAPASHRFSLAEAGGTGYPETTPPWLSTWLMIVADNTMHLLINTAAVRYL